MWRHIASNALTMLIVAIFLLGGLILWGQTEYSAEGPLEEQICLRVERGSNVSRVSKTLEDQGAITSGMLLRVGMDYADLTGDLKAGSYLVPAKSTMKDIADIITRGGASTCGTEIVYRIGVTQLSNLVRELDPATSTYIEKAKFDPAAQRGRTWPFRYKCLWQGQALARGWKAVSRRCDTRSRFRKCLRRHG